MSYLRNFLSLSVLLLAVIGMPTYAHPSAKSACENVASTTVDVTVSSCFRYVRDYLEDALYSESQLKHGSKANKTDDSKFYKRAMKTRVGDNRVDQADISLAGFCLPDGQVTEQVVLNVLDALKQVKDKARIDQYMVHQNIKRLYPCVKRY